jgi:hypothetical protein
LTAAIPDASLRETGGSFVMEVDYFGLPDLCEIIRAHADARQLPGWDPSAVQLRDLTDPTCRTTIMALGTWSVELTRFPNVNFYMDAEENPINIETVDRVEKSACIDVVLNTVRATIVATVYGTATELRDNGKLIGLAGFVAEDIELEARELAPRDEPHPEIVVNPNISIVFDPSGVRFSHVPVWDDSLGYRSLSRRGPELRRRQRTPAQHSALDAKLNFQQSVTKQGA